MTSRMFSHEHPFYLVVKLISGIVLFKINPVRAIPPTDFICTVCCLLTEGQFQWLRGYKVIYNHFFPIALGPISGSDTSWSLTVFFSGIVTNQHSLVQSMCASKFYFWVFMNNIWKFCKNFPLLWHAVIVW